MYKVLIQRNVWMTLALAFSMIFSAACSKNANTANSTNSTTTTASNTTDAGKTTGGTMASSPTAAVKAYYQAAANKDFSTARKYLSSGTMSMMEEGAKKLGKSMEDAFKEDTATTAATMPEFSNEKITGDTATVDLKGQGQSVTMPLVKEGGEWKLAIDKLIREMSNTMGGGAKEPTKAPAEEDEDEHSDNANH